MRLVELADSTKQGVDSDETTNGLELNKIYTYQPKLVTDELGKNQRILTVYSFDENHTGKKSYAMIDSRNLSVKILDNDHFSDSTDRVMRVRIISDVNQRVARFSLVNGDFTYKPDGSKIEFSLLNLPDFDNLDQYTDSEFYTKFGRRRLVQDHGLVGYLYVEDELQGETDELPNKDVQRKSSNNSITSTTKEEPEHKSKMDAAISIFLANKSQGRKRVIELFQRQLGMTPAGASSYYTKCKNAVKKGNVR